MSTVVKAVFAFGVGIAAVAGVLNIGLLAIKQRIYSESALRAGVPSMTPLVFDSKDGTLALPKPPQIDTRAAQEAAINSYARNIDRQIRAANSYVPQPRTYPGVPRF